MVQVAVRLLELPSPDKLRGLALGLGVPYSIVLRRALESCGYLVTQDAYGLPLAPVDPVTRADAAAVDATAVEEHKITQEHEERLGSQIPALHPKRRSSDLE